MSDIATTWAKAQNCPSPRAKSVLTHLATYADAEGEAWALVAVLALELQVEDRTVQRGLAELRKAGLISATGEMKRHAGRQVPIYRLALDQGPANTRQRIAMERGGERGGAATGDSGVTPRVTPVSPHGCQPCHPTGDTGVTQIGKVKNINRTEEEANASPSERADAGASADEGLGAGSPTLRTAFGRWCGFPGGAAGTLMTEVAAEWPAAAVAAGGEARLLACVEAMIADPVWKTRTYGPGKFQRWLREGGFEAYLTGLDDAAARPVCVLPPPLEAVIVQRLGGDAAAAMAGIAFDGEAVTPRTTWSFDKLKPIWPVDAPRLNPPRGAAA